jgi:predicted DNA-binding transcriptional regulator YafY
MKHLLCAGWITPADAQSRLSISRATAFRLVAAIEATEPVERDTLSGKLHWRLPPGARVLPLRVSTAQMVALAFVRNALGFLRGTGMDDDLADVFDRLDLALKGSDAALHANLGRKLYDRNEAAYDYSDKIEVVDDVITALLREERLTLISKEGPPVTVDPYTLALYKKGLYLVAYSHPRRAMRSFGLDKIVGTKRHPGERFDYPEDWDPTKFFRGWGIMSGPQVRVRVRFDANVAPFVKRRQWHPTAKIKEEKDKSLTFTVDPHGNEEMVSWVLGFGSSAEVLAPDDMRARIADELRRAAARYDEP